MDAENVSKKWYYERRGAKCGPVPASRIRRMVEAGDLSRDTLVYSRGMDDWVRLGDTDLLNAAPPPSAPPETGETPLEFPSHQVRWLGRLALIFDILAKVGSILVVAAGIALAWLHVTPLSRPLVIGLSVAAAAILFLTCKTSSAALYVQQHMARQQHRLVSHLLPEGQEAPDGSSTHDDKNPH